MNKLILILLGIGLAALVAFVPTLLWYTFDDSLAELTKTPALGELDFWFVFLVTFFIRTLTASASVSSS